MWLFYVVVALSAFLLFLVQPIIAKQILPWFGGSAAVWTTALVFFQTALLVGYAYADIGAKKLDFRKQARLHIAFALLTMVVLPIIPGLQWRPTGGEAPIGKILLLLTGVIGLPYVLLSTTSPLVQSWFARAYPGRDPYRLFAVSNAASVLALVSYPFVLEPNAGTARQAWLWSGLFVLFVGAVSALAWRISKFFPTESVEIAPQVLSEEQAKPNWKQIGAWLGLSATGSVLLLSVTNHLSHNIPSVPMMWLLPLTIYLITFILTFDGRGWYARVAFIGPTIVAAAAMMYLLINKDYQFDLIIQTLVFSIGLFICCMLCHGELVASKPPAAQLTRFYLCVSIGGALGSALVGIIAPLVLPGFYEMGIALIFVACVLLWMARAAPAWMGGLAAGLVVSAIVAVYYVVEGERDNLVHMSRNFYGAVRVKEYGKGTENHYLRLVHGAILHGEQFTEDKWRRVPTTYYTPTSGVGRITEAKKAEKQGLRLGMIGLGVGTYAAYGRAGDVIRFYDIDPAVITAAKTYFTYLSDSAAKIELALGDARLNLEKEQPQRFDILAVDAFSGDSIPTHLITTEAVSVFLRHINADGVLAFHVSNRFLDLPPVLEAIARQHKLMGVMIEDPAQEKNALHSSSTWVLLARDGNPLRALAGDAVALPMQPGWRLWTDDYNNLAQVLKTTKADEEEEEDDDVE